MLTMDKLDISDIFAVDSKTLYDAWIDTAEHAAMTASNATVSAEVGGTFSVWDGYATGKNVALQAHTQIVQTWRTTEFAADAPDSLVTVNFEPLHDGGTKIHVVHENLPQGSAEKYAKGWFDFYFTPMQRYFRKKMASAHYSAAAKTTPSGQAPSQRKPATAAKKKPASKPTTKKRATAVKAKPAAKKKATPKRAPKAAPKKKATTKKTAAPKPAKRKTVKHKPAKPAAKRKT